MSLTVDRLRELLDYDKASGCFTWRFARRGVRAGMPAGAISHALGGYVLIGVDRTRYYAHRLAWLHTFGEWPSGEIDHINGVPGDNRIANLRIASSSEQKCNMRRRRDNTSGYKGVILHRETGKWRARVKYRGHIIEAGLHASPEAAHEAYKHAAIVAHKQFARFG